MNITSIVSRSKSSLARLFYPPEGRSRRFEGHDLPPLELRSCGARFHDDAYFVQSAVGEASRLRNVLGLGPTSRLLEVGCGAGRTAIGLLYAAYPLGTYDGIDINARAIAWCTAFISASHPQYHFWTVNAKHERWNPRGAEVTETFSLPFNSGVFDIVYLHSVFSNMIEKDVRVYTRDFQRLLARAGRVFLTAFVEEGVPPVTINPANYVMECRGPLHIVRYERQHLLSIFTSCGFEVERFDYRAELDGQSGIYLRRGSADDAARYQSP